MCGFPLTGQEPQIGPVIGGLLLEYFWWSSVLLIGVPVMVLLLVVAPKLLPEYKDPVAGRLDVIGAALSLFCVLLVIFSLQQIAQDGAGWQSISAIAVGLIVGGAFV